MKGKSGLGTIYDGKSFLIIGGMSGSFLNKYELKKSERCEFYNASMTCHEVEPSFKTPPIYPILFLLDENYYQ